MRAKTEGRASPCSVSARNVCIGRLEFFTTLHMSTNDHKGALSIDFWECKSVLAGG